MSTHAMDTGSDPSPGSSSQERKYLIKCSDGDIWIGGELLGNLATIRDVVQDLQVGAEVDLRENQNVTAEFIRWASEFAKRVASGGKKGWEKYEYDPSKAFEGYQIGVLDWLADFGPEKLIRIMILADYNGYDEMVQYSTAAYARKLSLFTKREEAHRWLGVVADPEDEERKKRVEKYKKENAWCRDPGLVGEEAETEITEGGQGGEGTMASYASCSAASVSS